MLWKPGTVQLIEWEIEIFFEISRNSVIMLLCAVKEAYLEQTILNHY